MRARSILATVFRSACPTPTSRRAAQGLLMAATLFPAGVGAVELARVEGFGPVSRGMASAGVAHPVGAAAMLLNPAGLLQLDSDREWMAQFTRIFAAIEITETATGDRVRNDRLGNNRGPYDLPELAFAARRGNWAFGTGVFAAGGFGIEFGTDSFLSRTTTGMVDTGLPISSRIAQLRIPFAMAWQASPRWQLGASVDVVSASVNLASLLDAQQVGLLIQSGRASGSLVPVLGGIPNLAGAHLNFVRDNLVSSELAAWGVGGRLGATYVLTPATRVALVYEFKTALSDLDGRGEITAIDTANQQTVLPGAGALPGLEFPEAWIVGVSHQLTPTFSVVADLRRTRWSRMFGDTNVRFDADGGGDLFVSLPTGFRDLTTLAFGAEWRLRPEWTLRAGASRVFQQLVADENLNGAFPTLTRSHITAGAAWRPAAAHELSLAVSYGFTEVVRNPGGNVNSIPAIEGRNQQVNPVLSYRYQL